MRRALLVLSLLALTACSSGTPKPDAPDIPGLRTLAQDPSHEHREGPISYDEVPPLGGPHDPRWLRCEVYEQPVPQEYAVHSMEHGGVWLVHRPGVDVVPLARLKALSPEAEEYVMVSPLPGLPSPVVAATWGASLAVDDPSDPRLAQFVRAYAGGGQGGEKGVPCTSSEGALTPEAAEAELAAATPAPAASR